MVENVVDRAGEPDHTLGTHQLCKNMVSTLKKKLWILIQNVKISDPELFNVNDLICFNHLKDFKKTFFQFF